MCCGVVHILFSWFLRVPSLHVFVFLWKGLFVTCSYCFVVFLEIVGGEGRRGEDAWFVK